MQKPIKCKEENIIVISKPSKMTGLNFIQMCINEKLKDKL